VINFIWERLKISLIILNNFSKIDWKIKVIGIGVIIMEIKRIVILIINLNQRWDNFKILLKLLLINYFIIYRFLNNMIKLHFYLYLHLNKILLDSAIISYVSYTSILFLILSFISSKTFLSLFILTIISISSLSSIFLIAMSENSMILYCCSICGALMNLVSILMEPPCVHYDLSYILSKLNLYRCNSFIYIRNLKLIRYVLHFSCIKNISISIPVEPIPLASLLIKDLI
jgi:hypothetical protein